MREPANPNARMTPVKTSGRAKSGNAPKSGDAEVGGVRISHPDRIIYPDTDITKLDLAEYYHAVRDHILPFVAERPLSMVRCPEGIGGQCFFQRHIAREQSPHLFDTGIPVKGRNEDYLMIKDARLDYPGTMGRDRAASLGVQGRPAGATRQDHFRPRSRSRRRLGGRHRRRRRRCARGWRSSV